MHKYKLNIVFVIFCYARYFVFKLISCELYDDTYFSYFLYFFTITLGFNCKFLPQHSAHEIRKWHSCHEKLRCIVKPSKIALNLFSFRQRDILLYAYNTEQGAKIQKSAIKGICSNMYCFLQKKFN